LENRNLLPLSPGPVLPRFPDRAASVSSTQSGHEIDDAAGLRAETTLQVGRRMEDGDRTGGRPGSGSGVHAGRQIDVPHGGAALVRVQPVVGVPTAPSMSDQPSEGEAFHPAGRGGTPLSGGSSSTGLTVDIQREVQLTM